MRLERIVNATLGHYEMIPLLSKEGLGVVACLVTHHPQPLLKRGGESLSWQWAGAHLSPASGDVPAILPGIFPGRESSSAGPPHL
jgi:hypothetical protein